MRTDGQLIDVLAREIRAARARHGITLPDAAWAIGMSISALKRIESGKSRNCRGLTLMMILHWAAGLGYSEFAGFTITKAVAR